MTTFPNTLKVLLEDANVTKAGNRIDNEVRQLLEHGVVLRGAAELGHMAKDRSVSRLRAPSL